MKSKFKTLGFAAAFGVSLGALILASGASSGSSSLFKADENHKGYHYAQNLATEGSTGNAEFYACCTCHEVWLSKPSSGSFEDRAIALAEGGVNEKAKLYYVVLDANGGQGGASCINNAFSQSVLPSVTVPAKTDYNFLGYYDALTDGNQYIDSTGTGVKAWDKANNVTLYAHWTSVHTYNYVAEVPATIVSTGTKAHYKCSHCDKLFVKEDDNYVETTSEALVIAQLYADWSGDVGFDKFCTGGTVERVSASVDGNKLKLTQTAEGYYGKYTSKIHYSIKKDEKVRYFISINDVAWSSGCDLNTAGGYPGSLEIVITNNGTTETVSPNYYYADSNFAALEVTSYVNKNETNDVQIAVQVAFGTSGNNKTGEYVTIGSMMLKTSQTIGSESYDIASRLACSKTENLSYNTDGGKLTMTTLSSGNNYGTVLPLDVWYTDSIENAYLKVTIESMTDGAQSLFQLDVLDTATTSRVYIQCNHTAAGTYAIPLNSLNNLTGAHYFRLRFGVQAGYDKSIVISSVELVQLSVGSWNGNLDLSNFAKAGYENRAKAEIVDNKLRLTKFSNEWYGDFRSYAKIKVTKETGKTYKMTISDVSWGGSYNLETIYVGYYLNKDAAYIQQNWFTGVGDTAYFSSNPTLTSMTVDITDKLADGENTLSIALQMQYGTQNDGDMSGQYVDIGRITLSVE